MTLTFLRTLLIIVVLAPAAMTLAQNPPSPAPAAPANPLSAHSRMMYTGARLLVLRSAEMMPETDYAFRPVETVRTYGQIVGHIADSQYLFCSAALGEKNPAPMVEKTKTTKAGLVAALEDAFAYCDRAHDAMTDTAAATMINFMGGDAPKLGALNVNNVHTVEHYGNLVTYMRLRGLVPPTSDPAFMKEMHQRLMKK